MFPGRGTQEDGVVQFVIPQMKGKIQEGLYSARVEVLVENRYFSPVQFQLNFKKTMRVFAEAIQIVQPTKQEIKVSAVPLVVQQPVVQQPIIQQAAMQQPVQTVQQKIIVKEQEYVLENPFIKEKKQITNIAETKLPISKVSTKNKQKTLREKFASKNK